MEALAYTLDTACRLAAVSKSYIYEEIAAGRLVARKRGRRTVILADELEGWLHALPRAEAAA
jgi:excisionase family DNA binding protein